MLTLISTNSNIIILCGIVGIIILCANKNKVDNNDISYTFNSDEADDIKLASLISLVITIPLIIDAFIDSIISHPSRNSLPQYFSRGGFLASICTTNLILYFSSDTVTLDYLQFLYIMVILCNHMSQFCLVLFQNHSYFQNDLWSLKICLGLLTTFIIGCNCLYNGFYTDSVYQVTILTSLSFIFLIPTMICFIILSFAWMVIYSKPPTNSEPTHDYHVAVINQSTLIIYWILEYIVLFSTSSGFTLPHLLQLSHAPALLYLQLGFSMIVIILPAHLIRYDNISKLSVTTSKRVFVRYLSHEIRTPMNTISLGINLLKSQDKTSPYSSSPASSGSVSSASMSRDNFPDTLITKERYRVLNDVQVACDSALQILNGLLAYDQIEKGILQLNLKLVRAVEFFNSVLKENMMRARELGYKFSCQIGSLDVTANEFENKLKHVYVHIDEVKMKLVVNALISNAMKFSPIGSTIHFKIDLLDPIIQNPTQLTNHYSFTASEPWRLFPFMKSITNDLRRAQIGLSNTRPHEAQEAQDPVNPSTDAPSQPAEHPKNNYMEPSHLGELSPRSINQLYRLRLSVIDEGQGINAVQASRIFSEMVEFQPNQLLGSASGHDSGLGLHISKSIIEMHNGSLNFKSDGIAGKGSTFSIEVPYEKRSSSNGSREFDNGSGFVSSLAASAESVIRNWYSRSSSSSQSPWSSDASLFQQLASDPPSSKTLASSVNGGYHALTYSNSSSIIPNPFQSDASDEESQISLSNPHDESSHPTESSVSLRSVNSKHHHLHRKLPSANFTTPPPARLERILENSHDTISYSHDEFTASSSTMAMDEAALRSNQTSKEKMTVSSQQSIHIPEVHNNNNNIGLTRTISFQTDTASLDHSLTSMSSSSILVAGRKDPKLVQVHVADLQMEPQLDSNAPTIEDVLSITVEDHLSSSQMIIDEPIPLATGSSKQHDVVNQSHDVTSNEGMASVVRKPRALIVDDSAMTRKMLNKTLSREGFECIEVTDGDEAVREITKLMSSVKEVKEVEPESKPEDAINPPHRSAIRNSLRASFLDSLGLPAISTMYSRLSRNSSHDQIQTTTLVCISPQESPSGMRHSSSLPTFFDADGHGLPSDLPSPLGGGGGGEGGISNMEWVRSSSVDNDATLRRKFSVDYDEQVSNTVRMKPHPTIGNVHMMTAVLTTRNSNDSGDLTNDANSVLSPRRSDKLKRKEPNKCPGSEFPLFDVILMDYVMERMNGPEATQLIRGLGYEGIILGVTGNALPDDVSYFISKGADTVLTKPMNLKLFKKTFQELREQRKKS